MITHLMWKYDCLCNEEGKYQVYEEYLNRAKEIAETLPSICDSREIVAISNYENYFAIHKNTLEELIFHLQEELFGYCADRTAEERIKQYNALQALLELIYPDSNYGKNTFNRLYNYGHLGHLYQQIGDEKKALAHLKQAAEFAVALDSHPDETEQAKRFYNCGTAHREMSACEFMKTVMTEHYPLGEEFKATPEFKEIIKMLG